MSTYHKLKDMKIGPFGVQKRIQDNGYVIDIPAYMRISSTFNLADLDEYFSLDELYLSTSNSRMSFISSGGD